MPANQLLDYINQIIHRNLSNEQFMERLLTKAIVLEQELARKEGTK